ncbi:MAG: DUF4328 domain-containing protein [Bacteroidota bacterium]
MLKPNAQRAQWAVYSFYALLVLTLAFTGAQWLEYESAVQDNILQDQYFIRSSEVIALFYLGGLLVNVILFIMWFRRAYFNLHTVGTTIQKFDEGWAAGAWFIPLLNLVRPYQIGKEIWYNTQRAANFVRTEEHGLVRGWWILFLLRNFVDRIASEIQSPVGFLVIALVEGMAIIAAILYIKRVAKFEEQLAINYDRGLAIEEHFIESI